MEVSLNHYLFLSSILFVIGLTGVVIRRNLLINFMSLELMLNAANLALIAVSHFRDSGEGQIMVFFIITVAAAEVAVGLAMIVALYRRRQDVYTDRLNSLKL